MRTTVRGWWPGRYLNPLWWAFLWANRYADRRGKAAFRADPKRTVSEMRNTMLGPLMVTTGAAIGVGAAVGAATGSVGKRTDLIIAAVFALGPAAMTVLFVWEIWWRLAKPHHGELSWEDAQRLVQKGWIPTLVMSLVGGAIFYLTGPP